MDVDELRPRLKRAKLHIGLVADTLKEFLESKPAPIGFASLDLDLYSSTVDAFTIFEQESHCFTLPRVHCYFDDIMGLSFSEFTGERRAIEEFNARHERRKIAQIFGLKYFLPHSSRISNGPRCSIWLTCSTIHSATGPTDSCSMLSVPWRSISRSVASL